MEDDDDEILNLQLDLDEKSITQGSIEKVVKVYDLKDEFFIIHHAGKYSTYPFKNFYSLGAFRIRWDLWIILFVLYNCNHVPFEIAYEEQLYNTGSKAFGYFVDANSFIDILFNFRTTYIDGRTGFKVIKGK